MKLSARALSKGLSISYYILTIFPVTWFLLGYSWYDFVKTSFGSILYNDLLYKHFRSEEHGDTLHWYYDVGSHVLAGFLFSFLLFLLLLLIHLVLYFIFRFKVRLTIMLIPLLIFTFVIICTLFDNYLFDNMLGRYINFLLD